MAQRRKPKPEILDEVKDIAEAFLNSSEHLSPILANDECRIANDERSSYSGAIEDIVSWGEKNFRYRDEFGRVRTIKLFDHQKRILRDITQLSEDGRFKYQTIIYSCPKKSGKTTINALFTLYYSLLYPYNEILVCANDFDQAASRVFEFIRNAIILHPELKDTCKIKEGKKEIYLPNGTIIRAIPSDYAGAAGASVGLSSWDELWGFTSSSAERLWDELTPIPTKQSVRFVSTYAGFEGESKLLWGIYNSYVQNEFGIIKENLLYEDLPVFVNGLYYIYWDSKTTSGGKHHRLPWQTEDYYKSQYKDFLSRGRLIQYIRLHDNEWTRGENALIDMDIYDSCVDSSRSPLPPGSYFPLYLAVDIGIVSDHSAVVGVYQDPEDKDTYILALTKNWTPDKSNPMDIEDVKKFLRFIRDHYNIAAVGYDPYQFHQAAMELESEGFPVVAINQSDSVMVPATMLFIQKLASNQLKLYPDGTLRDHVGSAKGKEIPNRGVRVTKKDKNDKIDLAVALIMAVYLANEMGGSSITSFPSTPLLPRTVKLENIYSFKQSYKVKSFLPF
jgi:phage terminase large subunit-like protein